MVFECVFLNVMYKAADFLPGKVFLLIVPRVNELQWPYFMSDVAHLCSLEFDCAAADRDGTENA